MKEKVVGILGGMGPEATVDLMQRIISLTPALDDIDHIRCIIDNNPKVPSRIKAIIEGTGTDPAPELADMARRLEGWGADFLAMPCNTAHHYYNTIKAAVEIPVINIIRLTVNHVLKNYPQVKKIGILASPAVIMTNLYQEVCEEYELEVIYPDPQDQDDLFSIIRTIKTGKTTREVQQGFEQICTNLVKKGAETLVIACTELGVISRDLSMQMVDAADVLAQEIVAVAKNGKPIE